MACERHIREGLKAGLINGIITVSEMTGKKCVSYKLRNVMTERTFIFIEKSRDLESVIVVEDLSLPSTILQQEAVIS